MMTTESPLSLTGSSDVRNWPMVTDAVGFSLPRSNVAAQELDSLLSGSMFHGDRKLTGPNRCGSAPPSIEASLVALGNLTGQHNSGLDSSFGNLSLAVETCGSEEQLRAHPAYLTYYCSNVNLNPRLPPPLVSRENRHLVHHIGGFMDNWRMPSFDNSSKGSLLVSGATLSTHKEEPEDGSPRLEADENTMFASQKLASPLQGRPKSLVDLIQEDFPRTPSPVYNNQSRPSSRSASEQAAHPDALTHSLHDSSSIMAIPELETTAVGVSARTLISCVRSAGPVPNSDVAAVPAPCLAASDEIVSPHCVKGKSSSIIATLDTGISPDVMSGSNIFHNDKATNHSKIFNVKRPSQYAYQQPQQNKLRTEGTSSKLLPGQIQMGAHGTHHSNADGPISHDQSTFASVELQPVLHSTDIAPPLYATEAAYGTPYYLNFQPSSTPPFNVGAYALNTPLMAPLITGYPPNSAIHIHIDNHGSSDVNVRNSGVPFGNSFAAGADLQQFYKFYGQLGVPVQPSFPDPLYMPYFPHLSIDAFIGTSRYDPMLSGRSSSGSFPSNYDLQRGLSPATYVPDLRAHDPRSNSVNTPTAKGAGSIHPDYYGSSSNMGVLMQYPTIPLPSPVSQGSLEVGTSFSGKKTDKMKLPFSYSGPAGMFFGQGQRGRGKVEDSNLYSYLEELKSRKDHRFELSDIAGRVVEFSTDQHGSRFIQQKLENCGIEEKTSVFKEVLPHSSSLMTDVFGNYVIQKFFEHGSPVQRKELADQLVGHILPMSLQMYGCRVIQKALEVIELDQKTLLVYELDGHVLRCVRDQNGNHVIQKCIECVPTEKIGFIISSFRGQVATLSMHPYGCRVIQRVLEHCTDELQIQGVVDEILQSVCILAQDQYGNYVAQHVLERGKPHERRQIISKLAGKVVQMSQHKFASNVIEKCLEHGDTTERQLLIEEIIGQTEGNDNLLIMMKDQFANYVVQKFLGTCTENQREILLNRVKIHLQALKKYTYGKHIAARVEQLCGEDTQS